MNDWNGKCGGLAGSRVGNAQDIVAFQSQRYSLILDGRGYLEALSLKVAVDNRVNRKILEPVLGGIVLGLGGLGLGHKTCRVYILAAAAPSAAAAATAAFVAFSGIVN